jgi:hypothetical protein
MGPALGSNTSAVELVDTAASGVGIGGGSPHPASGETRSGARPIARSDDARRLREPEEVIIGRGSHGPVAAAKRLPVGTAGGARRVVV